MNISPSPVVITTKDGSNHTLFTMRDFMYLVEQYMGYESRNWLESRMDQLEQAADYTEQRIDTDLTSYESSLDSNRTAFQDIEEKCREMISDFNKEQGRNRLAALRPWRTKVEEIIKIINNQI